MASPIWTKPHWLDERVLVQTQAPGPDSGFIGDLEPGSLQSGTIWHGSTPRSLGALPITSGEPCIRGQGCGPLNPAVPAWPVLAGQALCSAHQRSWGEWGAASRETGSCLSATLWASVFQSVTWEQCSSWTWAAAGCRGVHIHTWGVPGGSWSWLGAFLFRQQLTSWLTTISPDPC